MADEPYTERLQRNVTSREPRDSGRGSGQRLLGPRKVGEMTRRDGILFLAGVLATVGALYAWIWLSDWCECRRQYVWK